jgi:hypothetical protein
MTALVRQALGALIEQALRATRGAAWRRLAVRRPSNLFYVNDGER